MSFPGSIPSTNPQNLALPSPVGIVSAQRDPGVADTAYTPGNTEWFNSLTGRVFKLTATGIAGATWDPFAGPTAGDISTVTGDSGGVISGNSSGNINILGTSGQISVTGNSATNTLTLALTGGGTAIDTLHTDDAVDVQPTAAGLVNVGGGSSQGIKTVGTPNRVSVQTNFATANTGSGALTFYDPSSPATTFFEYTSPSTSVDFSVASLDNSFSKAGELTQITVVNTSNAASSSGRFVANATNGSGDAYFMTNPHLGAGSPQCFQIGQTQADLFKINSTTNSTAPYVMSGTTLFSVDSGAVTATFSVSNLFCQSSQNGTFTQISVQNTHGGVNSSARFTCSNINGAGDTYVLFDPNLGIGGATRFEVGVTQADVFKINSTTDTTTPNMSGTTLLSMAPDATIATFAVDTFENTKSAAGINLALGVVNTDNTNASSSAELAAGVGGASAGDPLVQLAISGVVTNKFGLDNSDSDSFVYNVGCNAGTSGLDGTTVFKMLQSGSITKPLQPAFFAYLAATATNKTGNGASYTLGTDALTEVYDQQGNFNTNGTFTAPVTGIYDLRAQITITGTTIATSFVISIVTTGRTYISTFTRAAASTDQTVSISALASMSATNTATVTIVASGEAGDTDDILGAATAQTYFCGALIC